MFVQVAPGNACSRNPENPIKNKPMVPRTTPAARTALDHEWLKASPLLVAHQTPDQDSLPKSYLESDTGPFGNPLCQQALGSISGAGEQINVEPLDAYLEQFQKVAFIKADVEGFEEDGHLH